MIHFRFLPSCCLLIIALTISVSGQTQCCVRVTLLQLNDVRQFMPVDRGQRGGLARISTLRKQIMKDSPNTLLLFAGNTLSPSVESIKYKGQQMIDAWNAVGLDYATLGSRDFDFGSGVLLERVGESRFKWLVANVFDKKTKQPLPGTLPFVTRDFEGVKIGVFGLLTPETKLISSPGNSVDIRDPNEEAAKTVKEMRNQGARVIIALTHLSLEEDKELARRVPGIDLIIGGQTSDIQQALASRTPILKMSADARDLGRVDLNINRASGKLESIDTEIIPVTGGIADDPQFAFIGEKYAQMLMLYSQMVGSTRVILDARAEANNTGETNVGNFIADAFRREMSADVAIINAGSIGADMIFEPGPLSLHDVLSLQPLGYQLVKLKVSGAVIHQALEHGVGESEESSIWGRFPQVSGLRFTYDINRPPGSRVIKVLIGGRALQEKMVYTLATNSFLSSGGGGYSMLQSAPDVSLKGKKSLDSEVLRKAIASMPAIAPQTDGRIGYLADVPGFLIR